MADRSAIFKNKGGLTRIGYVEGNEAFDLSGRPRCIFNAASGNLCDLDTGKVIGHVSLEGIFVGASWIADELFGQHAIPIGAAEMPSASSFEERSPAAMGVHATDDRSAVAPVEPENALLERAIGMVRSVLKKGPS
jgi:hypothetical protein